jgi:signal transduction histidine kinase
MPEGGSITIRSRLIGQNAVLEVSDTGGGMSEEVKRSCLDPFFTTKGPQVTGMGLPMV